jgi:hypothetical protein
MGAESIRALGATALPIVAILSLVLGVGLTLAVAGDTLGYDFLAYHQAVERLLSGAPLYDMSYTDTLRFGLFYYPPTFAPLILAFGALEGAVATWTWIVLSLAVFLVGVAVLPTGRDVRWWIILLAGWSFPFVHAVKLGQVGPVLFALFAIGWRWLDRPAVLGATGALGAAIKIQPGLVLLWALLSGRWRAVVAGAVVLGALALVATALAGVGSWTDFVTLVRTVSAPITAVNNLTPGAVAYQAGVPESSAAMLQVVATIAALGAMLAAIRWCTPEASYLAVVIVSQLVSPILWDHYAMLLLLPVAYLLAAGRWWALVIPLATAWPLVGVGPAAIYPLAFAVTLVAILWVGRRETVAA